jgi:hypothetical protein
VGFIVEEERVQSVRDIVLDSSADHAAIGGICGQPSMLKSTFSRVSPILFLRKKLILLVSPVCSTEKSMQLIPEGKVHVFGRRLGEEKTPK